MTNVKRCWQTCNKSLVKRGSITFWIDSELLQRTSALEQTKGRPKFKTSIIQAGWVLKTVQYSAKNPFPWMSETIDLGIEQIFTSYNNPKGNAETERMMRTLKEELLWLREWGSLYEAQTALDVWIKSYNESYLHSAHGYRSPAWAEKNYKKQEAA